MHSHGWVFFVKCAFVSLQNHGLIHAHLLEFWMITLTSRSPQSQPHPQHRPHLNTTWTSPSTSSPKRPPQRPPYPPGPSKYIQIIYFSLLGVGGWAAACWIIIHCDALKGLVHHVVLCMEGAAHHHLIVYRRGAGSSSFMMYWSGRRIIIILLCFEGGPGSGVRFFKRFFQVCFSFF